jgi:large subunit ribosomal protein L21
MYAVVESGGKQYRVEQGSVLVVDRLKAEAGDKVALKPVLFKDKEIVVDAKGLEKVKIEATVTEHLRGDKIKVFKYKPKKGYSRRAGHRAELTKLEITSLGGAKKAAPKKAAADKAEEKPKAEAKAETTEKKAPAKKPAAKKPAAKAETKTETKAAAKKPAAKKPAAKKPATKKEDTDGA